MHGHMNVNISKFRIVSGYTDLKIVRPFSQNDWLCNNYLTEIM